MLFVVANPVYGVLWSKQHSDFNVKLLSFFWKIVAFLPVEGDELETIRIRIYEIKSYEFQVINSYLGRDTGDGGEESGPPLCLGISVTFNELGRFLN